MRVNVKIQLQKHPDKSLRAIAKMAGCSKEVVQGVKQKLQTNQPLKDAPRIGRPRLLRGEQLSLMKSLATRSTTSSSMTISNELLSDHELKVSPRCLRTNLLEQKLKFGTVKKTLALTSAHKDARKAFAQKHKRTDWLKLLFTDSKMFLLHKEGQKCWYDASDRPTSPSVKHSPKVHVYLGVSAFGVTEPYFVSDGSKATEFRNSEGKAMRGLGSEEYNQNVLPFLLIDGDRLFSENRSYAQTWIFQQDNAPAHTAKMQKELLNGKMPDRWIEDWPACSPDLSPIENVWHWAEVELNKKRKSIQDSASPVQMLRSEVEMVLNRVSLDMCRNLLKGMSKRMDKVIQFDGLSIGK